MKISSLFTRGAPTFSFEFFPPKTAEDAKLLHGALKELEPLKPDFVSVTSSPAGGAKLQTAALARLIKESFALEPMVHLTGVVYSRADVEMIAAQLKELGIENVLALRGDIPPGNSRPVSDYAHADELVAHIKKMDGFCIGVAGYPQKHPEADTAQTDLEHLKLKTDAGADFIITQLFFDNALYFSFVKKCRAAGITVPVIPGLMPVTGYAQLQRFAKMCGVTVPPEMGSALEKIKDDRQAVADYGAQYALAQARGLLEGGAPGIHFYTLNKSASTRKILGELRKNLTSKTRARAV